VVAGILSRQPTLVCVPHAGWGQLASAHHLVVDALRTMDASFGLRDVRDGSGRRAAPNLMVEVQRNVADLVTALSAQKGGCSAYHLRL
jgi:hypothetical protein